MRKQADTEEGNPMDTTAIVERSSQDRTPAEPPLLMKAEEAARLLDLGRSTIYAMLAAGELRAVRRGRAVRVERAELLRWIQDRQGAA